MSAPRRENIVAGDRNKDVERPARSLLTIRPAGNGDPERAIERGGAAQDLDVEARSLRRRLPADHQEIIAVARLGADRAFVRPLDFRDDLDRFRSGLGRPRLLAFIGRRLHHRLGPSRLFGADLRRCFLLVVEMDHGRRNVPRARKQTDQPGRKLPARAGIDRDEQALDVVTKPGTPCRAAAIQSSTASRSVLTQ